MSQESRQNSQPIDPDAFRPPATDPHAETPASWAGKIAAVLVHDMGLFLLTVVGFIIAFSLITAITQTEVVVTATERLQELIDAAEVWLSP